MFTNKEEFNDRPEIIHILNGLEIARKNNDTFAVSILLKRLEILKITLVSEDSSCKFGYLPVESK